MEARPPWGRALTRDGHCARVVQQVSSLDVNLFFVHRFAVF